MKGDMTVLYHIELGVAGMVDGPAQSSMSIDERLSRLKLYQSRWRKLSYTRRDTVYLPRNSRCEFASGIVAQESLFDEESGSHPGQKIFLSDLPGDARDHPQRKEWTLEGYDFPIIGLAMDPTQDLLVIM